jgi:predicted nucleic-acid-binding Zn-ribbon protein
MVDATQCPKCGKSMAQGHVPDMGHADSWRHPSWVAGSPTLTWWGGLKKPEHQNLQPLAAMRCEGCGFVEFYARKEFRAR